MNLDIVYSLITAKTSDLQELAKIAGINYRELYYGTDWSDVQLSDKNSSVIVECGGIVHLGVDVVKARKSRKVILERERLTRAKFFSANAIDVMERFIQRYLNGSRNREVVSYLISPIRVDTQLANADSIREGYLSRAFTYLVRSEGIFKAEKDICIIAFLAAARSARIPADAGVWEALRRQTFLEVNAQTLELAFDPRIAAEDFLFRWSEFLMEGWSGKNARKLLDAPHDHPAIRLFELVYFQRKPIDTQLLLSLVSTLKHFELVLHALGRIEISLVPEHAHVAATYIKRSIRQSIQILDVFYDSQLSSVIKVSFAAEILRTGDEDQIKILLSENLQRKTGSSGIELFNVFSHLGAARADQLVASRLPDLSRTNQISVLSAIERVSLNEGHNTNSLLSFNTKLPGVRRRGGKWVQS